MQDKEYSMNNVESSSKEQPKIRIYRRKSTKIVMKDSPSKRDSFRSQKAPNPNSTVQEVNFSTLSLTGQEFQEKNVEEVERLPVRSKHSHNYSAIHQSPFELSASSPKQPKGKFTYKKKVKLGMGISAKNKAALKTLKHILKNKHITNLSGNDEIWKHEIKQQERPPCRCMIDQNCHKDNCKSEVIEKAPETPSEHPTIKSEHKKKKRKRARSSSSDSGSDNTDEYLTKSMKRVGQIKSSHKKRRKKPLETLERTLMSAINSFDESEDASFAYSTLGFEHILDADDVFEDLNYMAATDYLEHIEEELRPLKFDKNLNLDSNQFFFAEDQKRPLKFHTKFEHPTPQRGSRKSLKSVTNSIRMKSRSTLAFVLKTNIDTEEKNNDPVLNNKKNIQRIVVDGEIYKIGDLFNNEFARMRSDITMNLSNINSQRTQKLQEEKSLSLKVPGNSSLKRKSSILKKIMEKKNDDGSNDDEEDEQESFYSGAEEDTYTQRCDTIVEEEVKETIPKPKYSTKNKRAMMMSLAKKHKSVDQSAPLMSVSGTKVDTRRSVLTKPLEMEQDSEMSSPSTRRPKRKESHMVTGMFKSDNKFKSAVKLVTQKSLKMRKIKVELSKSIVQNRILTRDIIRTREASMMSEFMTGYAYAFDMDEELMKIYQMRLKMEICSPAIRSISNRKAFVDTKQSSSTKRKFDTMTNEEPNSATLTFKGMLSNSQKGKALEIDHQILNDIDDEGLYSKKVFAFSRGDYTHVYSEMEENGRNSTINSLMEL